MKRGGGWAAIYYSMRMALRVGPWRLFQAMRTKNACKTCALGMGGQRGGMVNELGYFPEVCKKSFQAMVADMQAGIKPEFFAKFSIDQLRTLTPRELEYCGRLTQPIYAGPGDRHFRMIDWEEALQKVASKLHATPADETFYYASGRCSNEAAFLFHLFARMMGTNYVNNCSYYCHQASGVGLSRSLGTGTATVSLEDVEHADLFFLIGGNPASNHPRLMRTLMNIRRKGGQVIVINPVKEVGLVNFSIPSDMRSLLFGSPIASHYLQPHIGGDIALLTGIAKKVLENNAIDQSFLDQATEGANEYLEFLRSVSWQDIESNSGISKAEIETIANIYCQSKNAVFGWTMGITHHEHGVENVQTIVNLALLRGMVGRPQAGLLPIRGHSNVQGVGSVGVTPTLKKAIFERMESELKINLPTSPGLDTMACMKEAADGNIRAAICLGGNLFGSNPDSRFAFQALKKIEQITYLSTTLNTGHVWGMGQETLILPVRARDEEPEPTTQESMFNFVRLSAGGPERLPGTRTEMAIIAELGQRIFGNTTPIDWADMGRADCVRQMIAKVVPGFEDLATIDKTQNEFTIPGRILHTQQFPTESGKAKFAPHAIPQRYGNGRQLRMMTVRSEGQFNTVVYEEQDIYRGQERRDVVLLNHADIDRLGLKINQRVRVRSSAGELGHMIVREFDIRAGNALMYFPEANILVPKTTDPASKTPAFKCVLIDIEPESAPTNGEDIDGARLALTVLAETSSA